MPKQSALFAKIFLAFTVAAFGGCAKEKQDGPPEIAAARVQVVTGSIEESVNKVQEGAWHGDCDEKIRGPQLALAKALDARRAAIEKFLREKSANDIFNYRRIPLGPIMVKENAGPPSIARAGWQSDSLGWADLLAYYEKIKNAPVDDRWAALNQMVRGTLADDLNRAAYGFNSYLTKDSAPGLALLVTALTDCMTRPSCAEPEISGATQEFVNTQPDYRDYLAWIRRKSTLVEKRSAIGRVLKFVKDDQNQYEFQPNSLMRRVAPGKYELAMDPGPFAAVKERLAAYVENTWSGPATQVRIRWVSQEKNPEVYRVQLGEETGGRAFVNRRERKLVLYPDVRATSIPHEFGHVMGFQDTYFTVWHPESCSYESQYREDDIMSESSTGVVLNSHWEDLARHYQ